MTLTDIENGEVIEEEAKEEGIERVMETTPYDYQKGTRVI